MPTAPRFFRRYENQIFFLAFGSGAFGGLLSLVLLWSGSHQLKLKLTLSLGLAIAWIGCAMAVRQRVQNSLFTFSNMLSALREGDYSLRLRDADRSLDDAALDVSREINHIGDILQAQRRSQVEATALMQRVMDEIDIAIIGFDEHNKIRLANRRAERLIGKPLQAIAGRLAEEVSLTDCLGGDSPRLIDLALPGGAGRWELRRAAYRVEGEPHQLVVLSDLTHALREEERQAWMRLVQVLRHEINNSLAPIHSLAESLTRLIARDPLPEDWQSDMTQGLNAIGQRANSLNRFMSAYSNVTRLPKPKPSTVSIREAVERAVSLETRMNVNIADSDDLRMNVDAEQFDQLLTNLIRNAVEAALESGGGVQIGWKQLQQPEPVFELHIEDEGPGIANSANLFVPFFTTKPEGTGLGLMLCRQIVEAHLGSITLINRSDRSGCQAIVRLPILEQIQSNNPTSFFSLNLGKTILSVRI